MSSRPSPTYAYTPLRSRPLTDIPYESDEEAELKRRAIRPDHPPVDIRRRPPARSSAPAPPVGVAVSSGVVVVVGLCLVLMGLDGFWVRVGAGVLRVVCGVVGGFCVVSGSYTLYHCLYHGALQHEGGYLFPSYHR